MSYTIAIIGSCVADVIINIPHLPKSKEDIHITSQSMSLGGCAWNAAHMLSLFDLPYALCTPVGQGIYGEYVKSQLKKHHTASYFPEARVANGCCYCLVDASGERSFLADHGAEYQFQKEWFSLLDEEKIHTVYICGLEIEEASGQFIIDYLQSHPGLTIYFACGPRICAIEDDKMKQLFDLHCILHLNKEEALSYTGCESIAQAASFLYNKTKQTVIITMGEEGCYLYEHGYGILVPTQPKEVIDTIGAGDVHIGTIIALREKGIPMRKAVSIANHVSGAVISKQGSLLSVSQLQACLGNLSLD